MDSTEEGQGLHTAEGKTNNSFQAAYVTSQNPSGKRSGKLALRRQQL